MKTKLFFLRIFLYFTGISCTLTAQTIEKRVGNTVYVVDTVKRVMENKENKLFKTIDFSRDECHGAVSFRQEIPYPGLREIFSEEHIKEWGKSAIAYKFICDSTGLIREVKFLLSVNESNRIPLSDFKKLEDCLKQVKLILSLCPGKEYYTFIADVSYYRLYGKK